MGNKLKTTRAPHSLMTFKKSGEMKSSLPDFQIKQRTTAEQANDPLGFTQPPTGISDAHEDTHLLTQVSVGSDGQLGL